MSAGGPSPTSRIRRVADLLAGARNVRQRASRLMAEGSHTLLDRTLSSAGSLAAFLATPDLVRWSESITSAAISLRDRALGAEHLRASMAGADQPLIDGGRDLLGAWQAIRGAGSDPVTGDVIASVLGLWKDLGAVQGLSFAAVDRAGYDAWARAISSAIPGVKPSYLTDLLSVDSFEVLSAGLGSLAVLLCLSRDDQQRLSEILGAMGITSIIAANPLMGLVVIAVAGYSYFKQRKLDLKLVAQGAAIAGVSAAVFATLGLPILVELVIVVVLVSLLRKHVLDNEELIALVRDRVAHVGQRLRERVSQMWNHTRDVGEPGVEQQPQRPRRSTQRSDPWRRPTARAPRRRARAAGMSRSRPGGRARRRQRRQPSRQAVRSGSRRRPQARPGVRLPRPGGAR